MVEALQAASRAEAGELKQRLLQHWEKEESSFHKNVKILFGSLQQRDGAQSWQQTHFHIHIVSSALNWRGTGRQAHFEGGRASEIAESACLLKHYCSAVSSERWYSLWRRKILMIWHFCMTFIGSQPYPFWRAEMLFVCADAQTWTNQASGFIFMNSTSIFKSFFFIQTRYHFLANNNIFIWSLEEGLSVVCKINQKC